MGRTSGIIASIFALVLLSLLVLGTDKVSADVKGFVFSALAGGAIGGFGLAKGIYQRKKAEDKETDELPKPRAKTPDDIAAEANATAHTQTAEDMYAQN